MRDDFSQKTKEILAKRAGMQCSNPKHRVVTNGPHDDPSKFINIGVAAHITAASPGGKRYDASLSEDERSSPENGIWLCQNCAKLVDSDESRFTAQTLRQWKELGEMGARIVVETSRGNKPELGQPELGDIRVLVVSAEDNHAVSSFNKYARRDHRVIRNVLLSSDTVDHILDASFIKVSEQLVAAYDIIHFVLHVENDGCLVMGNDHIPPAKLGMLLGNRGLKCAAFMTCNSANVIGVLQATNVEFIIAATSNLFMGFSEAFCRAFYSALSNASTIPDAFEHANTMSSQAMTPFANLRLQGSLCLVQGGHNSKGTNLRSEM